MAVSIFKSCPIDQSFFEQPTPSTERDFVFTSEVSGNSAFELQRCEKRPELPRTRRKFELLNIEQNSFNQT
jgi:hypothetical protein